LGDSLFLFICLFLLVLGFELMAWHLLVTQQLGQLCPALELTGYF
jgi:hypothetical protein